MLYTVYTTVYTCYIWPQTRQGQGNTTPSAKQQRFAPPQQRKGSPGTLRFSLKKTDHERPHGTGRAGGGTVSQPPALRAGLRQPIAAHAASPAPGRCRRPPLGGTRLPPPRLQPLPRPRPRPGRRGGEGKIPSGDPDAKPFSSGGAAGRAHPAAAGTTGRWARPRTGTAAGPRLPDTVSFSQPNGKEPHSPSAFLTDLPAGFLIPSKKKKKVSSLNIGRSPQR